jgi:phosphonopyruvate decarboxylase
MHMGSLPIAGSLKPANLLHVVFNNSAHESVGGQPTVAGKIDFKTLVTACGYSAYEKAHDEESLRAALARLQKAEGPAFLEVLVEAYSRDDLGRPKSTPEQNKLAFIEAARG